MLLRKILLKILRIYLMVMAVAIPIDLIANKVPLGKMLPVLLGCIAAFLFLRSNLAKLLFGGTPSSGASSGSVPFRGAAPRRRRSNLPTSFADSVSSSIGSMLSGSGSGGYDANSAWQARQAADQAAFDRWKARENAAFHDYQARNTRGADSQWHRNMAQNERDKSRRF